MPVAVDDKQGTIDQFKLHGSDTGSPEIQVALLTSRINHLTGHLQQHKKDHASRQGLLRMVGRRATLLKYLGKKDQERYQKLIGSLGIRK